MKKLLAIVILGMLWCGNVNAKIIKLQKCHDASNGSFDHQKYDYFFFKIDLNKKILEEIRVYSDNHLKILREAWENSNTEGMADPFADKIKINQQKIIYKDNKIIKSEGVIEVSGNKIMESNTSVNLDDYRIDSSSTFLLGKRKSFYSQYKCY